MTRPRLALLLLLALAYPTSACEPEVVVGDWPCATASLERANGEAGAAGTSLPVELPWSTSFEEGFCGYSDVRGFCYADADPDDEADDAWYKISSAQAHSGRASAAFRISTAGAGQQSRCVREGILPSEAYYGAWFLIPESVDRAVNWNLMHFRGGDDLHGLWDVTVGRAADGGLFLYVFDFLHQTMRMREGAPRLPVGEWFRVVFFLRRAADDTGEVRLYQDDQLLLRLTNIATDDSSWGQWYSGNFANALSPSDATIYMDDVTIDSKL
jgi:hypothetical protein